MSAMRAPVFRLCSLRQPASVALLSVLAAALGFGCEDNSTPAAPNVVRLGILSGLDGTTEPCGCTSKPLGGLDRLAAVVEGLQKKGPFRLLVAGNTLVSHADPPAHLFDQERAKARTIAELLQKFAPLAMALGPKAAGVQNTYVRSLLEKYELPAFRQPSTPTTRRRADSVITRLGGIKIGVVGMPHRVRGEASSYTVRANYLRQNGAQLVVALLPVGGTAARQFVGQIDGVDVAVAGGAADVHSPRMVKGTLLVEAGDRGRYLGVLELHRIDPESADWVYDDRGAARRRALTARIGRLEKAVGRLPSGPAKKARQNKLTTLRQKLSNFNPPEPQGNHVTWAARPITQNIQPTRTAAAALEAYNDALCNIAKRATADRECAAAPTEKARYVGTERCRACHSAAFEVYTNTAHAHAWATLENAGKDCDPTCIGCHTVGFEKPGGFCRLADAPDYANVGCENCHGPGSGHVQNPTQPEAWASAFEPKPSEPTCVECHNPEHSDTFAFSEYLPNVLGPGHGEPLER